MKRSHAGPALILLAALAAVTGCEQRVVSAKGIGTDRYVVQPDPPPTTTSSKSRFVPPRTTPTPSAARRSATPD